MIRIVLHIFLQDIRLFAVTAVSKTVDNTFIGFSACQRLDFLLGKIQYDTRRQGWRPEGPFPFKQLASLHNLTCLHTHTHAQIHKHTHTHTHTQLCGTTIRLHLISSRWLFLNVYILLVLFLLLLLLFSYYLLFFVYILTIWRQFCLCMQEVRTLRIAMHCKRKLVDNNDHWMVGNRLTH